MRGAFLAFVLILAACGSASAPQAKASPSPSATLAAASPSPTSLPSASPQATTSAKAEFLFAVTEQSPAIACTPSSYAYCLEPNEVAIVGLDGYARAKAKFQPRANPGVIEQGVAQVAGYGLYYIDGFGTVRLLRANTAPQVVASFPQRPGQYDTWFAVSPDGSRVLAGVLKTPVTSSTWVFDLEAATAGGQTTALVHSESANEDDSKLIFPAGWTSKGPVAMVGAALSTQNYWPGGSLYVIDDSGKKATQLGGSDCQSDSITSSGLIPCVSSATFDGAVTVRDQAGKVLWTTHVDGSYAVWLRISPDGQAISSDSQVETHAHGMVTMPAGFRVQGWLDTNTVVGRVQQDNGDEGNLFWISLSHPTILHDLGFKGDFVATMV